MNVSGRLSYTWRSVFKALIIYGAGAWASIEVVDFAVTKYGLSRLLLDVSVVVAFGGGMITAVLAWYHSERGQQKVTKPEVAIVGTLIFATAAGIAYVGAQGPTATFDRLDGYRLIFVFRDYPGERDDARHIEFRASPMLRTTIIDEGVFYVLDPDDARIKGTNIDITWKHHPVMFHWDHQEWVTITIVLPFQPAALARLQTLESPHDQLIFEVLDMTADIGEPFDLIESPSGATIKFAGTSSELFIFD